MAKQSGLLKKMEQKNAQKYKQEFWCKMDILRQMCIDSAFMAANDVFNMGPGRCEQFGQAMCNYLKEIALMISEDGKTDDCFYYTRKTIDRRLKKICGDKFQPWEVRYGK